MCIKNVLELDSVENSVQLLIDLADKNLTVNGRAVDSITMYASTEMCGDLAVNWQEDSDSDYTHNTTLAMRDSNSNDSNTNTMRQFYNDCVFNDTLAEMLIAHGFSKDAVNDVYGSEWGMQDAGRASYDAVLIAEEMLAVFNLTTVY